MASIPRNFVDYEFYHVYNRGNHKEVVYHSSRDYEKFLWMLRDAAAEHGVGIAAYCLMPNHFHLLLQQLGGGSISRCITTLTLGYVKYYNKNYAQVGHLFQGKYGSRFVRDSDDLLNVSRYIHQNPLGYKPIDEYEWSSYRAFLGERSLFCDPGLVMKAAAVGPHSYARFCDFVKNSEVQRLLNHQVVKA